MGLNASMPDFVAGSVVTEADLDALSLALAGIQAPWDSWAPTLTGFDVGNGTLVTKFLQLGATVLWRLALTAGSTTTFSGTLAVSLPLAPSADHPDQIAVLGSASFLDASAGSASRTGGTACRTGSSVYFLADRLSPATVTQAVPWTWAVGDVLSASGSYETTL